MFILNQEDSDVLYSMITNQPIFEIKFGNGCSRCKGTCSSTNGND